MSREREKKQFMLSIHLQEGFAFTDFSLYIIQ